MIWKDVFGYEGLYQVSEYGDIRSARTGKLLKPYKEKSGYLKIQLRKLMVAKTVRVHQLVASAFLGPCPDGLVVAHGANGKSCNHYSNLTYKTIRENSSEDRNRDEKFSSKFPGVSWDKPSKKWRSFIYVLGKLEYLGSFEDESLAAEAYRTRRAELGNSA